MGTFKQFYEGWFATTWQNNIGRKLRGTTFFAVSWSLWKLRNGIIFQQKQTDQAMLCNSIKWRVALWSKGWKEALPYSVEEIVHNLASIPGNV